MTDDTDDTTDANGWKDQQDTAELTGRVVTPTGDLAAFVTVSVGTAADTDAATQRARDALASEFADDPELTLVNRFGDEVVADE